MKLNLFIIFGSFSNTSFKNNILFSFSFHRSISQRTSCKYQANETALRTHVKLRYSLCPFHLWRERRTYQANEYALRGHVNSRLHLCPFHSSSCTTNEWIATFWHVHANEWTAPSQWNNALRLIPRDTPIQRNNAPIPSPKRWFSMYCVFLFCSSSPHYGTMQKYTPRVSTTERLPHSSRVNSNSKLPVTTSTDASIAEGTPPERILPRVRPHIVVVREYRNHLWLCVRKIISKPNHLLTISSATRKRESVACVWYDPGWSLFFPLR